MQLDTKQKFSHEIEKGQALLFVVIVMTIALSIGINASVRTITSLSRTTRTDTASRALAAAEGGIERFLALSTPGLEDAVDGTCPSDSGAGPCMPGPCPPDPEPDIVWDSETQSCKMDFEGSGDILVSQAFVTVERYTPSFYPFDLESGQVKEVNLYDFNGGSFYSDNRIEICWSSSPESDLVYLAYNQSGVQARGGLFGVVNTPGAPYAQEGFTAAVAGHDGYDSCATVDITNNIYGLRIRSVGGASRLGIFPVGGASLPLQGYTIVSIGRLEQDQGVTATRTIRIVRTLPYLPASFDYALYSEGAIVK